MFRAVFATVLLCCSVAFSQTPASCFSAGPTAAFDAATIKPPDPNGGGFAVGFYGQPGGRVYFGGTVNLLIESAFRLQTYQLSGGPGWIRSAIFTINAVPPSDSPSRSIKGRNAEPTPEQRLMLQSLLRNRFGLQCHTETKEGEVYILSRGTKPLTLEPPKDKNADPRAIVFIYRGGIVDGSALGSNTTTDYMAEMFSRYLHLPVLNQTGISGSWDYKLDASDPTNHDIPTAVFDVVDRLGLKLKRSRGPITTLVIDKIDQPSQN